MSLPDPYLLVERDDQLQAFCTRLAQAEWLTVDTEFLREKTYYPQLCLIQVASSTEVACIDPQKVSSLDPLVALFANPNILKIFHAARQDMEMFWHSHRMLPAPVFDTQVAAPLLGYSEQMGYASLVKERLGIEIDKSETRTDWSRRPLTDSQLDYAAADVRHLAELFPKMRDELQQRGRLDWLVDDFAVLTDPATYENHPEQAWRRLRGLQKFRGPALSCAQALAAWREQRAQQENRPRKWVLDDDALMTLARIKVQSVADLKRVRGLPPQVIDRYGEQLIALLDSARQKTPEPVPDFERPDALTEDQEAAVDVLTGVLRQIAATQALNPTSIAARKDLQELVRGERAHSPLLRGWRRGIAGEKLLDVLEGRCRLHIQPNGLVVEC
ncbi:MAG: ribonuclease D [Gammaproteobacteria bacterium]|nr:ribonuclease D [Gammaproteobacteria bacterium]